MTRHIDPIDLATYRDTGCGFWEACLTCPFDQCVFDVGGSPRTAALAPRNALMQTLHANGVHPNAIARRFRVNRATVYRALQRTARRAG